MKTKKKIINRKRTESERSDAETGTEIENDGAHRGAFAASSGSLQHFSLPFLSFPFLFSFFPFFVWVKSPLFCIKLVLLKTNWLGLLDGIPAHEMLTPWPTRAVGSTQPYPVSRVAFFLWS